MCMKRERERKKFFWFRFGLVLLSSGFRKRVKRWIANLFMHKNIPIWIELNFELIKKIGKRRGFDRLGISSASFFLSTRTRSITCSAPSGNRTRGRTSPFFSVSTLTRTAVKPILSGAEILGCFYKKICLNLILNWLKKLVKWKVLAAWFWILKKLVKWKVLAAWFWIHLLWFLSFNFLGSEFWVFEIFLSFNFLGSEFRIFEIFWVSIFSFRVLTGSYKSGFRVDECHQFFELRAPAKKKKKKLRRRRRRKRKEEERGKKKKKEEEEDGCGGGGGGQ